MRVVPLYVNFGTESFRDHVEIGSHDFYERLRAAPALPTTSQPTPREFLDAYEELARLRADLLAAALGRSSRAPTSPPSQAAGGAARDRIRVVDTETASLAVGDARARDPAASRAGHDRRARSRS